MIDELEIERAAAAILAMMTPDGDAQEIAEAIAHAARVRSGRGDGLVRASIVVEVAGEAIERAQEMLLESIEGWGTAHLRRGVLNAFSDLAERAYEATLESLQMGTLH